MIDKKVQDLADDWMISMKLQQILEDVPFRYSKKEVHQALDLCLDGKASIRGYRGKRF